MRGQKEVESWSGCVSEMSLGQNLIPDLNQATAADHSLHSSSAVEETNPVLKNGIFMAVLLPLISQGNWRFGKPQSFK